MAQNNDPEEVGCTNPEQRFVKIPRKANRANLFLTALDWLAGLVDRWCPIRAGFTAMALISKLGLINGSVQGANSTGQRDIPIFMDRRVFCEFHEKSRVLYRE